ncbi:MAG: sporulation membrane protein YtaF [Clostridiales bacterium]|nr:sporulation membrane protein YtaF [Clostridiales bacterium]
MFQFLLAAALCLDAFAAGFAYGAAKTRIGLKAMLVVCAVCTALLVGAAALGSAALLVVPRETARAVSFALLLVIGLVKSFESAFKSYFKRRESVRSKWTVRLFDVRIVLSIYAEPEKADFDASKSISPREAVYLAAALSLDGLSAGFGWGLGGADLLWLAALSLASNFLALALGHLAGKALSRASGVDVSRLGGLLLILTAFLRLVS